MGLQISARAICLLGIGYLEEVGQGSVTGLLYSHTQNSMARLTFRCLMGMLPGLCILLMPNAFGGLTTHSAPELSTWFSDQ